MDISSSSPFNQSISSNPEGVQEKGVSKERIQSVEPEVESLGAVGGEGVSSVPNMERSAETVSATNVGIFSVQEQSKKLFYGDYPISPVTEFTEAYLEKIIAKTVNISPHVKRQAKYAPAKLAALRVQTLIVKMIRGDDSDSDMLPLIKSIDTINKVTCNSMSETANILSITDSHYLWPIRKDCEKGHGLGASFSSLGEKQQEIYVRTFKAYLETIKGCYRYKKRILTAKEKSKVVTDVVKLLKEIKCDWEDYENKLASVVDKDEKIKMMKEFEASERSHYFVDEEIIELIDASNPNLRSIAEKCKYFIMPLGLIEINAFEKKLLACYNLCVTHGGENCDSIVDAKPLFFLDSYKELLRDELKSREITAFEGQQIACIWMMTLTKYFRLYQGLSTFGTCRASVQYSKNQGFGRVDNRKLGINEIKLGRLKCLDLTMWAQKNGFFKLAVHAHLQILANCVFMETKDLQSSAIINKLVMNLMEHANDAAIVDRQKLQSYSNYISLCERTGNKEKFYETLDIASQYSLLPILSEIWNNLGLSVRHHAWIKQKKLRPEYVIDYLIKLVEQKETLILIKENIEATVEGLHTQYRANVIPHSAFSPITTFYCYIAGEEKTGKELLQYGQQHLHSFLVFLSLIANKKFKDAIASVEKVLADIAKASQVKDKFKIPKNNVLVILALVYKRLADAVSGDEKTKYLQQALSYLYAPALIYKELYLSRAIIQEQLNDLRGAYDSYNILEAHCKTFPDDSTENCQLHFISQAKETLRERLSELSKNECLEERSLQ